MRFDTNMTVWGDSFDYAPTGLVGPLTAELTLQELERRGYIHYDEHDRLHCSDGEWNKLVFPLPVSNHFLAVALVERATIGLRGRINIFSVDALSSLKSGTLKLEDQATAAECVFIIPYGFVWDDDDLFAMSNAEGTPVNDALGEYLIRDLIIATGAGIVSY